MWSASVGWALTSAGERVTLELGHQRGLHLSHGFKTILRASREQVICPTNEKMAVVRAMPLVR